MSNKQTETPGGRYRGEAKRPMRQRHRTGRLIDIPEKPTGSVLPAGPTVCVTGTSKTPFSPSRQEVFKRQLTGYEGFFAHRFEDISKAISQKRDAVYDIFLQVSLKENLSKPWESTEDEEKFKSVLTKTIEHFIRTEPERLDFDDLKTETYKGLNITSNKVIWEKLLSQDTWLTSSDVGLNAGSENKKNPSSLANGWKKAGKIFAVSRQGKDWYPAYEFMDDGHPIPVIRELLGILKPKSSNLAIACWFENHNSWLGGAKPKEVLLDSPDELLKAARVEVSDEMHG